jgi:hypothetical protein
MTNVGLKLGDGRDTSSRVCFAGRSIRRCVARYKSTRFGVDLEVDKSTSLHVVWAQALCNESRPLRTTKPHDLRRSA